MTRAANIDPDLAFLDELREIAVISNSALADAIQAKVSALPLAHKQLTPIASLHGSFRATPSDLLGELAMASAPPLPVSKLLYLTHRWAWLRYCWAFRERGPKMRPTEELVRLVAHHRTLAAEQLGIALALVLARSHLRSIHRAREVKFIDADVALLGAGAGSLGLFHKRGTSLRPDYFALVDGFDKQGQQRRAFVYSIECKGSFTSGHNAQLVKAAQQVIGVQNKRGGTPPSLLFATGIRKGGFRVRVLDPDGDAWSATPEEVASAKSALHATEHPDADGLWKISDIAGFIKGLEGINEAQILSFAGQVASARSRMPELPGRPAAVPLNDEWDDLMIPLRARSELPSEDDPSPTARQEPVDLPLETSAVGREQGVRTQVVLDDGRLLRVFAGVEPERLQASRERRRVDPGLAEQPHDRSSLAAEARSRGVLRRQLDGNRVLELQIG